MAENDCGNQGYIRQDGEQGERGKKQYRRIGSAVNQRHKEDQVTRVEQRGCRDEDGGAQGDGGDQPGEQVVKEAADQGRQAGRQQSFGHLVHYLIHLCGLIRFGTGTVFLYVRGDSRAQGIDLNVIVVIPEVADAAQPAFGRAALQIPFGIAGIIDFQKERANPGVLNPLCVLAVCRIDHHSEQKAAVSAVAYALIAEKIIVGTVQTGTQAEHGDCREKRAGQKAADFVGFCAVEGQRRREEEKGEEHLLAGGDEQDAQKGGEEKIAVQKRGARGSGFGQPAEQEGIQKTEKQQKQGDAESL